MQRTVDAVVIVIVREFGKLTRQVLRSPEGHMLLLRGLPLFLLPGRKFSVYRERRSHDFVNQLRKGALDAVTFFIICLVCRQRWSEVLA